MNYRQDYDPEQMPKMPGLQEIEPEIRHNNEDLGGVV